MVTIFISVKFYHEIKIFALPRWMMHYILFRLYSIKLNIYDRCECRHLQLVSKKQDNNPEILNNLNLLPNPKLPVFAAYGNVFCIN